MGQEPRRRRSPARFAAVISCSRDAVSSRDAHDTRLAVKQNRACTRASARAWSSWNDRLSKLAAASASGVERDSVERSACGFAEPIGRDASFSTLKAPGQDSNLCHQPAFAQDLYLGAMRDFAELKRRACVLILPVGRRIHLRPHQVIDPPFRVSLPRLDHLGAILEGRGRLPSHCVWLARAVPVLADIHEPKHRRDCSSSASGCDHAFDHPAYGKPRHCAEQEHRSEDQDVLRLHKLRFETQLLPGERCDGSSWAI
jgi:hypothetical protein